MINFYHQLQAEKNLNAIIIGAMDGVSHDTIKNYINKENSKFIFVEPVTFYMKQLKQNFGINDRFTFIEKAIGNNSGKLECVRIKSEIMEDDHLSKCLGGLTSINPPKNNLKDILNDPNYKHLIEYVEYDSITISDLSKEINLKDLNFIQIDTEGYDLQILKQFDLTNIKYIKLEHWHLSLEEKEELKELLKNDYNYTFELEDVYAVRKTTI